MKREFFTVNILIIINFVCTPLLAESNPSKQADNETGRSDKLCYELLQQTYPKKPDQLAYAAGYEKVFEKF